MTIVTLGIDLGKTLCSIAGMDADGAIVMRRRGEAIHAGCAGRQARALRGGDGSVLRGASTSGCSRPAAHEVRLMSPEYVQPYVKAQKNDDRDAEAIAEAATRPTMRFVELKSQDQLDLQTLHRARSTRGGGQKDPCSTSCVRSCSSVGSPTRRGGVFSSARSTR